MKSINQMSDDVVAIFKKYDNQGTNTWTWETAVKDLPYQVGSLSKASLQLSGDRFTEGKSKEELKIVISDELSDILAEVLFIASELDIDIHQAWQNMLDSDNKKISERSK